MGGQIVLADEVLTPDSSRFWPADQYAPGKAQPSYDKQFVRDYLEAIQWNKQPPAPGLPSPPHTLGSRPGETAGGPASGVPTSIASSGGAPNSGLDTLMAGFSSEHLPASSPTGVQQQLDIIALG